MARRSPRLGLVLTCLVLGGYASTASAVPPTVADMCKLRPRMDDVNCTNPTPDEQAACKIEPVVSGKKTIGWLLVDAKKQGIRRVLDTNNDDKVDVWCFYKDGLEVYREIDSNFNTRADQYRWFNDGGMKWGVDSNEDGKIDSWRMISADEVGLEIFRGMLTKDFERLRPLFISETEMRALKMSQSQIDRIKGQIARAPAKFREALEKQPIDPRAQFLRVEAAFANCKPGDTIGMDSDLICFPARAILYEVPSNDEKKQHDWIQAGEMIQVGLSWRLADLGTETPITPPPLPEFVTLNKIDGEGPGIITATNAKDVDRMVRRANVVEEILKKVPPEQREQWIKQLLDNLFAAAFATHMLPNDQNAAAAMVRLGQLRNQLEKALPGSNLAGNAVYRELGAIYLGKLSIAAKDLPKVQAEWHEKLGKFVQDYPSVDDTPDALQHLGIGSEFAGKDEEAKRWYTQIFTNFPDHPSAAKAKGSVRRLSSIGQDMELASPTIDGSQFNITQLKGKVVAVYYWASYCDSCAGEFAKLKQIQTNLAGKGVEIVCVSLDDDAQKAGVFLQKNNLAATHLFQQAKNGGGLNSPVATHYGINGLPTLFLVGRDGKVISRTLQVNDLEDALRKAL